MDKDMSPSPLTFDPLEGLAGQAIPQPLRTPPYMELWEVERDLNFDEWRLWVGTKYKWSVHFGFVYVMGIFLGQIYMRRRAPLKLRGFMTLWNFFLAVFSLVGFIRSWPEVRHLLNQPNGFYRVTCSREGYNNASALWSLLGVFSKVMELGDTFFLVAKKRRVIFLHWFHHATVMMYTWSTFEYLDPSHRWFTVMNYFIHAIMYTYYGLRSMGFSINKRLSMSITLLQVLQMVAGIGINVYSLFLIHNGTPCARRVQNVHVILLMYFWYLVLFAQFFYSTYIAPKRKQEEDHANGKCHCE